MEILFVFILLYAGKHAWDQAWDAWRKSRSAYLDRADKRHPDMPKSRRTGHALRHDLGYGLSQAAHGFPRARHGFASGWHQGRQAHAQAQAERERVKAEHLETRARLIPDLIEYRKRQKEALERIRRSEPRASSPDAEPEAEPEAEEGSEGSPADGHTYSWGPEDSPYGWPADDAETAHRWARHMSTDGTRKVVTEYPPGGGPGRTAATYAGGRHVCGLCDKPLPPGGAGTGHPDCIDAREDDEDDITPTEGDAMPTGPASGDTTYTQQLNELTEIRQDAEHEVNSVRVKRMMNRLDVLTGLGLDSASLSEAAAIDDALQAQQKAAQQTLDAADAAIHGLKQRHGGIQEAVSSSPVDKPAQPEFYQD